MKSIKRKLKKIIKLKHDEINFFNSMPYQVGLYIMGNSGYIPSKQKGIIGYNL